MFQPQDRGGLGIRSPKFINLAFGGKIVWRLITGPPAWWKKVLEIKYLNFPRQQLLDQDIPNRYFSKIWCLCKREIPLISQNTSKIPKGGASINIGADRTMVQQPINRHGGVHPILSFFERTGIQFLDQISQWHPHTLLWSVCTFPTIPNGLNASLSTLQSHLHNIAPVKKNDLDGFRWDPSGSSYTIQAAHHYICNISFPCQVGTTGRWFGNLRQFKKSSFFSGLSSKGKSS